MIALLSQNGPMRGLIFVTGLHRWEAAKAFAAPHLREAAKAFAAPHLREAAKAFAAPLAAVALLACGPPPKTLLADKPPPDPMADEDKGVDVKKARALLERAEEAMKKGDRDGMKRLCDQAEPFANDTIREEIRQLFQRADQKIAEKFLPPLVKMAKEGQCQKCAEEVVRIGDEHKGTAVIRFIKDGTSKALLECLLKQLEVDVSVARDLAEVAAFDTALNSDDAEQWEAKLDEATVGTLVAGLGDTVQKRDWRKVVAQLGEMVARKEAGPHEIARVMKVVRTGITEDIEAKIQKGLGTKPGAQQLLKDVDALMAIGGWDASKDDAPPEQLVTRRAQVSFWAQCAALDCTLAPPAVNWAYGLLEIHSPFDVKSDVTARVKHGRQIWRIAEGRGFGLVADHDPGPLEGVEARVPHAMGWAPLANLASADTNERLPPGEALVGTRVWGGFRDKNQWELGVVREAKGEQITVERIADAKLVSARRADIRFGTLKVGTKVTALCVHPIKMEQAEVLEVVPVMGGDPHVKLQCLDDKGQKTVEREVLIGSLRTQPAWLPPRQ